MPLIWPIQVKYENGRCIISNVSDLLNNFPYLEGNTVLGKIVSMYRDGRIIRINQEIRCRIVRESEYKVIGELLDPNPIVLLGLPLPCDFLLICYKYEKEEEKGKITLPIIENALIKIGYSSYFEDEIKRIKKEEEAALILEGIIFHPKLEKYASNLKDAFLSFQQENFVFVKTACRRILEHIKQLIVNWKSIDRSKSLCEKFKSVVNSLYSFASIGGPHEGVTTREETEFILKVTSSLLFYLNSIMKNNRFEEREDDAGIAHSI